jgi:phosphatidylinositol alpha-mannosyltransferase
VNRIGLEDVHFIGRVSYDDLPRYYQTADVFCSPATGRESFGLVLLEAMALGKPVVATSIEGYASVITHDSDGIMVPPKDDRALAEALVALLNDKVRCREMGERGKLTAQKYRWEDIARRVFDFYLRAISQSSGTEQSKKVTAVPLSV